MPIVVISLSSKRSFKREHDRVVGLRLCRNNQLLLKEDKSHKNVAQAQAHPSSSSSICQLGGKNKKEQN